MNLSRDQRNAKLATLIEAFGFASLEDLVEAALFDSVSPAICMAPHCDYTAEMEPDQREGYCEACGRGTVQSALILAEII